MNTTFTTDQRSPYLVEERVSGHCLYFWTVNGINIAAPHNFSPATRSVLRVEHDTESNHYVLTRVNPTYGTLFWRHQVRLWYDDHHEVFLLRSRRLAFWSRRDWLSFPHSWPLLEAPKLYYRSEARAGSYVIKKNVNTENKSREEHWQLTSSLRPLSSPRFLTVPK